jgi:hypothetical protein
VSDLRFRIFGAIHRTLYRSTGGRVGAPRALADDFPGYDRYAEKTNRRIPVVVLEPVER